ncbi:MAG: hypothetical protein V2A65_06625 [Candidatus Omnitrophota bacterium]
MRVRRILGAVLLVLFLFSGLAGASVTVTDTRDQVKGGIGLNTGKQNILLRYNSPVDKEGKRVWSEPSIGLGFGPDTPNWYGKGAGFLAFELNGKNILLDSGAEVTIIDQGGKKGVIRFSWKHPVADVDLTAVVLENDDKLMLEFSLNPKIEVSSIRLTLLNYPGGMTEEGKARDRWIATAKRNVQHDAKVILDKDEFWVYYYDANLNPVAFGSSALMLKKDLSVEAEVEVCEYPVYTILTYPGDARKIRFALWKLPKGTNWKDGLEEMRGFVEKAQSDLVNESFGPSKKTEIKPR